MPGASAASAVAVAKIANPADSTRRRPIRPVSATSTGEVTA